jgi:hypothetical protein
MTKLAKIKTLSTMSLMEKASGVGHYFCVYLTSKAHATTQVPLGALSS